jgi:hypothetical protein
LVSVPFPDVAGRPRTPATEIHHRIPRHLLQLRARATSCGALDGEGLQAWADFELEALHYGVEPNISCAELEQLIEASAVELPYHEHRAVEHASDWPRWGRLGGLVTCQRYGHAWFSLLARKRWGKVGDEDLRTVMRVLNPTRSEGGTA